MNNSETNQKESIIKKIGLGVSIIDASFAVISLLVFIYLLYSQIFLERENPGSGWLLMIAPVIVAVFFIPMLLSCISFILYMTQTKKTSKGVLITNIILAAVGCIIIYAPMYLDIVDGFFKTHLIYIIYSVLKLLVIGISITLLVITKKRTK